MASMRMVENWAMLADSSLMKVFLGDPFSDSMGLKILMPLLMSSRTYKLSLLRCSLDSRMP